MRRKLSMRGRGGRRRKDMENSYEGEVQRRNKVERD